MKIRLNLQKCKMLKINLALLISVCCLQLSFAQTQNAQSKKEADIKKAEASVTAAKAKLTQAEKQVKVADSLITAGPQMVKESKVTLKKIDADRKTKDKEYKAKIKPINKSMKSKDKNEAADARKELAKVNLQYRTDMKDLDKQERDANKKIITGENNENKGKMSKKNASESLKRAQAAYDAAEEKLEKAQGNDEKPAPTSKKKKK